MPTAQIYTKDEVDSKGILYNVFYTIGCEKITSYSSQILSLCATFNLCLKERDFESFRTNDWVDIGVFFTSMLDYSANYDSIDYGGTYIQNRLDTYGDGAAFIPCSGNISLRDETGPNAGKFSHFPLLGIIFYDQREIEFIYLNDRGTFSNMGCNVQDLNISYYYLFTSTTN